MTTFFVDVNVPMYAAGADHRLKEPCAWILEAIVEGTLAAAIDVEIIREILYRYGAIGRRDLGVQLARHTMAIVPMIYPVTPEDMSRAVDLFDHHGEHKLPPRDCLHAAVMHNRGLDTLISTDRDFDIVAEITRIDPAAYFMEHGPGG